MNIANVCYFAFTKEYGQCPEPFGLLDDVETEEDLWVIKNNAWTNGWNACMKHFGLSIHNKENKMNCESVKNQIVKWLKERAEAAGVKGFIVGVSGGIDSALVSTLCAETGLETMLLSMPIEQEESQLKRAHDHMSWVRNIYKNAFWDEVDLTETWNTMHETLDMRNELAEANLASRLRMCALYYFANSGNYFVAGTGNKVEDYGIGFFTKYGDGGVDISPIGDLTKSEVRELARYLGVSDEIVNATPTDGLWEDNRSDEDQIGASYEELEWAMDHIDRGLDGAFDDLTERQEEVLEIYRLRHKSTSHKMNMPPVCKVSKGGK